MHIQPNHGRELMGLDGAQEAGLPAGGGEGQVGKVENVRPQMISSRSQD